MEPIDSVNNESRQEQTERDREYMEEKVPIDEKIEEPDQVVYVQNGEDDFDLEVR